MEKGGANPARPLSLYRRIPPGGSDEAIKETIRAMQEGMPLPAEDLKVRVQDVRSLWRGIKQPLLTIAEEPAADPEARAAFETIRSTLKRSVWLRGRS